MLLLLIKMYKQKGDERYLYRCVIRALKSILSLDTHARALVNKGFKILYR
jgi:hypothetical protein